eukprot:7423161-Alexandrium_andersonii.AAC.1
MAQRAPLRADPRLVRERGGERRCRGQLAQRGLAAAFPRLAAASPRGAREHRPAHPGRPALLRLGAIRTGGGVLGVGV